MPVWGTHQPADLRLLRSRGGAFRAVELEHAFGYVVVAAEIQRRLLPGAFGCDAQEFSLAGRLEPAGTVGGDTFGYALDRDTLHLSITDAVGNAVNAALLATVLVSSLRNGRRRGLDLPEQVTAANEAPAAHSPLGEFVTGQAVRVDLETGIATVVNAGHPLPILMRAGRVAEVPLRIDLPFGLCPDTPFALEPGDRILFLTDGVLDRNSEHVDVPAVLAQTTERHPREMVRALSDAVIAATGGDLKDDSTVLCLDWRGPDRA